MENSYKSAGAVGAQNHTRRKQRKADQRQEENNITRIEHSLLEALEMRDHTESSNGIDHPRFGPAFEQLNDRLKAREYEEQANHYGDDKTYDLIASDGGRYAAYRQVCTGQKPTPQVSREYYSVIRAPEVIHGDHDWKRHGERDGEEQPARQKLANDSLPRGNWHG